MRDKPSRKTKAPGAEPSKTLPDHQIKEFKRFITFIHDFNHLKLTYLRVFMFFIMNSDRDRLTQEEYDDLMVLFLFLDGID
jgi:hypothetical protein